MTPKRFPKILKQLAKLCLGIAFLGLIVYFGDTSSLSKLKQVNPLYLSIGLLLTLGINILVGTRWGMILQARVGYKVCSTLHLIYYFLLGRSLGFIVPKDASDFGVRTAFLVKSHGLTIKNAVYSIVFDRFFDFLTIGVFLISSVLFLTGIVSIPAAFGIMIGSFAITCLLLAWSGAKWLNLVVTFCAKALLKVVSRLPFLKKKSFVMVEPSPIDTKLLLKLYCYSTGKFIFTALRLYCFVLAFGLTIPFPLIFLATPAGQLSYIFAVTPGGLGIFEAGWYAILKYMRIPEAEITPFLIGQRTFILIFIISFTLIGYCVRFLAERKHAGCS